MDGVLQSPPFHAPCSSGTSLDGVVRKTGMGSHVSYVRWIHAGDMEDTSWRVVWDETPPGALQDNPLTQSSQPKGTQKIHVGSHPACARGKGRDAPGSVPWRTRILYRELQLNWPWNMRFSIPSKSPICFLVTCGYSCYSCK